MESLSVQSKHIGAVWYQWPNLRIFQHLNRRSHNFFALTAFEIEALYGGNKFKSLYSIQQFGGQQTTAQKNQKGFKLLIATPSQVSCQIK